MYYLKDVMGSVIEGINIAVEGLTVMLPVVFVMLLVDKHTENKNKQKRKRQDEI